MPAVSESQRRLIAIAEHHPEQVYGRNRSILGMKKSDMHDFASTSEKGLPAHVKKRRYYGQQ
jgi:hypothetical protein